MKEFPEYIRLKKDKYKDYGVHPKVTGQYKRAGIFYNNVVATPSLPAPTFSVNVLLRHPEDFEIIKEKDIVYE